MKSCHTASVGSDELVTVLKNSTSLSPLGPSCIGLSTRPSLLTCMAWDLSTDPCPPTCGSCSPSTVSDDFFLSLSVVMICKVLFLHGLRLSIILIRLVPNTDWAGSGSAQ